MSYIRAAGTNPILETQLSRKDFGTELQKKTTQAKSRRDERAGRRRVKRGLGGRGGDDVGRVGRGDDGPKDGAKTAIQETNSENSFDDNKVERKNARKPVAILIPMEKPLQQYSARVRC
jgi:hypothetical protein